jgi:hypothetical protein
MQPDLKRRLRAVPAITTLCGVLLLAACATTDETAPRQYLDEHTAATVTVGAGGLAFARSRTEYAVNARDYFSIVPVDVNRGGTHVLYLYCYIWSTIDRPAGVADKPAMFELVADGRQIPLKQVDTPLRTLGFGEIPVPTPANNALPLVSVTDREVLQFLVRAQALSLVATRDDLSERYDLWTDQRGTIEEFLHGGVAGR